MGSPLQLTLPGLREDEADAAWAVVRATFTAAEADLTRFDPDSPLSRLNRAAGRPVAVPPLLARALHAGLRAFRASGGRFDRASSVRWRSPANARESSCPRLWSGSIPPTTGWSSTLDAAKRACPHRSTSAASARVSRSVGRCHAAGWRSSPLPARRRWRCRGDRTGARRPAVGGRPGGSDRGSAGAEVPRGSRRRRGHLVGCGTSMDRS